jgi:hypothetical protein
MTRISIRSFVAAMALSLVVSTLAADDASANGFAGKIVTSDKRIPSSASSKSAYYAQLRKQSRDQFWENKEKKEWKIHYAAFFKSALNDLEVTVKIYDITNKQKRMVAAYEQWLQFRGQKEIISFITLDREKYGVNRQLLMTVENRGRVLAQGKFKILGQAEKFSGKVEFTEEEAASGGP